MYLCQNHTSYACSLILVVGCGRMKGEWEGGRIAATEPLEDSPGWTLM